MKMGDMDHDVDPEKLMELRRAVIMLLRALDKVLGLPQTIPPKEERHPRK
jgi:hypothetical protein